MVSLRYFPDIYPLHLWYFAIQLCLNLTSYRIFPTNYLPPSDHLAYVYCTIQGYRMILKYSYWEQCLRKRLNVNWTLKIRNFKHDSSHRKNVSDKIGKQHRCYTRMRHFRKYSKYLARIISPIRCKMVFPRTIRFILSIFR